MQTIDDLGSYTFPALLANSIRKFADRPALAFASGDPISYREVGHCVEDTRNLLYQYGVCRGDRVALFSGSSPNWGISYFAIVSLGAIAVPLLPDFNAKEVDTCLRHAEATTLIVSTKLIDKIPDTASLGIRSVILIDDFSVVSGEQLREGIAPQVNVEENDTASIIYTSGTTGRSKGVELSHKNLVWNAIAGQYFQRINKFDVGLSFLPMSHVYEFTIGFVMLFMNGASIYYLEKPPTVTSLLPALKKVRPTLIMSVPIIMEKIYKNKIVPTFTAKPAIRKLYAIPFFRRILNRIAGKSLMKTFGGRVKFFGIGGSKIDPTVEQFLKEARFPYAIGYGLTETAPLLAGSGPRITRPGTIGPGTPGVELKLIDIDPATGIGELVARGPNVMKGYYKDPAMTASVMTRDGWFRTGDLCSMDSKKGSFRISIKGRSKNMILGSSGENIYPEDIEFVLNQHPFVADSLVVEGENSSLVAIVQLDEEKVAAEVKKRVESEGKAQSTGASHAIHAMTEAAYEAVGDAVCGMTNKISYKREELLNEIKFFVNENVNRISRIDRVEMIEKFEKTASQKIKRYLYTIKKTMQGNRT